MCSDPLQKANSFALRLIAYRQRTESELRNRLGERFDSAVVERVLEDLKTRSLIDDVQFAGRWTETRISRNPRSASTIRREIVAKGVTRDIAESAVAEVDDEDGAYRAGLKHSRRLAGTDFTTHRRRLLGYLSRRGYGQSIARRTTDRLWKETRAKTDS